MRRNLRGQGLWDALKAKGFADEVLLEAGLAKTEPEGRQAPMTRSAIASMFPIRDPRGRWYRLRRAGDGPQRRGEIPQLARDRAGRQGAHALQPWPRAGGRPERARPLIVAEGYMDVIALVRAGFEAAVAPLGTAITEDQLRLVWRIRRTSR